MHLTDARIIAAEVLDDGYWRRNLHDMQQALEAAQHGHCGICGHPLDARHDRRVNNDHVWPRSLGGFNGPGNLVAVHRKCNTRKGCRLPTGCEIIWLVVACARLNIPIKLLEDDRPWERSQAGTEGS